MALGLRGFSRKRQVSLFLIRGKITTGQKLGHLLAFDKNWAWDIFQYPKLIDLKTGRIEWHAIRLQCLSNYLCFLLFLSAAQYLTLG